LLKAWYDGLPYGRTTEKLLMIVRAVFAHARSRGWIEQDPTAAIERQPLRCSGDYDFYSRDEINALVVAAASGQDAALFLTAAMTGLRRGELVALRWRDVDFPGQAIRVRANYSFGELVTPKSGKVRSVPMVPEVAQALARLSRTRRVQPALQLPPNRSRRCDSSLVTRVRGARWTETDTRLRS
jgi:integrase